MAIGAGTGEQVQARRTAQGRSSAAAPLLHIQAGPWAAAQLHIRLGTCRDAFHSFRTIDYEPYSNVLGRRERHSPKRLHDRDGRGRSGHAGREMRVHPGRRLRLDCGSASGKLSLGERPVTFTIRPCGS